MSPLPEVEELEQGLKARDRRALSKAITLVESTRPEDERAAESLLEVLLGQSGGGFRLGISGPPGVGKSTLIDALGLEALARGRSVAVLAIDPSSHIGGGSLMGDKTRMTRLAAESRAFVRPSPARKEPGGLAPRTREAVLLCETFGFDLVIVETVGVGQGEVAVSELCDELLVLAAAGMGDELQAMKRGLLEHADVVAVTKADAEGATAAKTAAAELRSALGLTAGTLAPPVLEVSAHTGTGVVELLSTLDARLAEARASGAFQARRKAQQAYWFERALADELGRVLLAEAQTRERLSELRAAVEAGNADPRRAARQLVASLLGQPSAR